MLRRATLTLIFCSAIAFAWQEASTAQTAAPITESTVVATLNGRKFTAGEVQKMVAAAGPSIQAYYKQDPRQFMRDYAYYLALVEYAETNKLDKQSPTKEQLELNRILLLVNAAMTNAQHSMPVTPEEQKQYYASNKDQFRKAVVKFIYIPFASDQPEAELQKKAVDIAKRARGGEDFEKLFKEVTPDAVAPAPQLDVTPQAAQPPQPLKEAIFKLKAGETSEALRHSNGYYIFRVESSDVLTYDVVRDDIYKTIQQARFQQWQAQLRAKTTVQFDNEVFFQQSAQK